MVSLPKVLIVDDDPAILDFLTLGLRHRGYPAVTADNATKALNLFRQEKPDLVVLDWMLPDFDGIEVCKQIREVSQAFIIMLTARNEMNDRINGLRSGADDYLAKPFHIEELVARIEALWRRTTNESSTLQYHSLTLDRESHEVFRGYKKIDLTPTEFDLLALFMSHPHQALAKELIVERIWGYDFGGNSNIAEVYVGYLRKKLGEPVLIHTVRGIGYVLKRI